MVGFKFRFPQTRQTARVSTVLADPEYANRHVNVS
jgi:hypothetical protein